MRLLIAVLLIFSALASSAQERGDPRAAPYRIGAEDTELEVRLAISARCLACDQFIDQLFNADLHRDGDFVSYYVQAINDGRLGITIYSVYPTWRDLLVDIGVRCTKEPTEALRRIAAASDGWGFLTHPSTKEDIELPWTLAFRVIQTSLVPDLVSEADFLACYNNQRFADELWQRWLPLEANNDLSVLPLARINGELVQGGSAIEAEISKALGIDLQDQAVRRFSATVSALNDAREREEEARAKLRELIGPVE